jgi:hypothetical protein
MIIIILQLNSKLYSYKNKTISFSPDSSENPFITPFWAIKD